MRTLLPVLLAACSGTKSPSVPAAPPADTTAVAVAAAMKPTVDPCQDFYAYACGGWLDSTELPPDRTIVTRSFTSIFDENQAILREILDGAAADPGEDPTLQKLGAFYGSCMDTEALESAGTTPIAPWFARVDEVEDLASAVRLAGELQNFGPSAFFAVGVYADDKNPGLNILHLHQGGLGLPDRSYYLDLDAKGQERLAAYQAHIARMFALYGDDPADAEHRAAQVVGFETELAKVHWERAALRDAEKTYNKMSLDAARALLGPGLPLDAWFAGAGIAPPAGGLNVTAPEVFAATGALLQRTDPSVLRDVLRWQLASWAAPYLTQALDAENFAFQGTVLSGQQAQQPRWKRCVARTEEAMGEWLGKAYVDRRFAGDSKAVAETMVAGIFQAFEDNLPALDWMDDPTRARAVDKANAFVAKLGYPPKYRDYTALPVGTDHFTNMVEGGRFAAAFYIAKIEQPVDRDEWHMTPQMVNAYYNPPQNEIVFPAGIMQAPFFSRGFPKAMNYGALGMVIGHELTHGFDDDGRKYDPTGRLEAWWAPEVIERFEERAQCVDDQYDAYEVLPGLNVNGKLTLGENIADLGGLKMSHLAYRAWVAEHGEEPQLAGLSGDQLFFVAFAQGWCTVATDEVLQLRVATDPHSPAEFRVNGPVSNYRAFADAFQCEIGSPMAPEAICEVW